jgi:predicted transcriptional regulator
MIYIVRASFYFVKNRSRPDIMAIILEAANGGITKTKLLTRANLTSGQLKQYLDVLVEKKLLLELADEDKRHTAYRTTEKGMRYLSIYSSLKSIVVFPQED